MTRALCTRNIEITKTLMNNMLKSLKTKRRHNLKVKIKGSASGSPWWGVLLAAPTILDNYKLNRTLLNQLKDYLEEREREERLNIKKLLHFVLQKIFLFVKWSRLLD